MTRVRRFALPLMVAAVVGAMPSLLCAERAFEGVYIASGKDSAGNEYQRAVEIERHGDRFIVTCGIASVPTDSCPAAGRSRAMTK